MFSSNVVLPPSFPQGGWVSWLGKGKAHKWDWGVWVDLRCLSGPEASGLGFSGETG